MQRKLIIIIGEVCSGKDHFANEFYPSAEKIDVGNIVRSITKTQARIHNEQLDSQICIEIHKIINSTTKDIVITGIRQLSIYNNIQQLSMGRCFKIITYYLSVPHEILKERFKQRASEKDLNISFEEVIERDNKLGLAELTQTILNDSNTEIYVDGDFVQKIEEW